MNMIAELPTRESELSPRNRAFMDAVRAEGFKGEICTDQANRTVHATDNSIYQRLPLAVLYPRDADDVQKLAGVLARPEHREVVLAPRGGGTGTNGQSLTDGVVVDLSRHMNRVLEIDTQKRWVRVQAGVVKDQLNAALKPHGLFFAPELSTSNRATLGGMINTDASGQGSCTYGKTRNHVLELDFVLMGGERFLSAPLDDEALDARCSEPGRVGKVYRTARRIGEDKAELIAEKFPKLNRCLTGYDLAHLREEDGRFNLNSVLCGAEGSLGFVVEARLNVLPIPKYAVLVNVRYASFMDALKDARALIAHRPLSIETVDSKVLLLAMKDFVWNSVSEYFPSDSASPTLGINLVEFSGDDPLEVDARVQAFIAHLGRDAGVQRLGHTLAIGHAAVSRVYGMRKRAVGLLGNIQGEARPQPFVEDTAVPPENLPEFIADFRALLDGHGLTYGMFGHVDAGVLHVRPAIDMKDPRQAALVRTVSDEVAKLTQRYGGLLWGEHGKGVRSEYSPAFFGELYGSLQQLKAAFDPFNQFNPGKIATPPDSKTLLLKIDGVPTRGEHDRQIDERVWQSYGSAMHCNGNGACYNFDPDDAMCPSWKATRQRVHSPKGRASLMREWLRLQGGQGVDVLKVAQQKRWPWSGLTGRARQSGQAGRDGDDFSHQVYDAMSGCLACKSCAGQCPIKVDVPEFRSRFLELYHTRYRRPLRDYVMASLEFVMPAAAKFPAVFNGLMKQSWVRQAMASGLGIVDSPLLSRLDIAAALEAHGVRHAFVPELEALDPAERARSVILVPDSFTYLFETEQMVPLIELATRLGYRVWMAPLKPNGKPLHVQGFLKTFNRVARRNSEHLSSLARTGIALVGLDPAMTLVYRQEYLKVPGLTQVPEVLLPQEWLARVWPRAEKTETAPQTVTYRLLPHCTERTNAPVSVGQWQEVFAKAGLSLQVEASGCCGMSGTYGHEARNYETSRVIFEQSWKNALDASGVSADAEPLATGYSCRSQVKRFGAREIRHPLQALLAHARF
ncbi:FAD-binding and (Fe-S)-binding domain-containing protein [Comamonas sp. BIGb0124]|uniref:D-2-hydroxyglutarate dehydrogenase YdiJ n=1 Tax=Comamonas sp. BIGb0124 TaxID=2485130 RepID=UPI00351A8203